MGLERYGLNVLWAGMPGMRWLSIVSVALCIMNCFGLPKAIVIHCGGMTLIHQSLPNGGYSQAFKKRYLIPFVTMMFWMIVMMLFMHMMVFICLF